MIYSKSATAILLSSALSTFCLGMETTPKFLELQSEDHKKTATPSKHNDPTWFSAVIYGNLEELKSLNNTNSAILAEKLANGDNALHIAANNGYLDIVKWLYEQSKTLLTEKNLWGKNALHIAVMMGHFEVAQFLIKTSPELLTEKCNNGKFPKDLDAFGDDAGEEGEA